VTSRRSAQDAEEKLQVAENDLAHIGKDWQSLESELEVARKLFDSEATTPGSNDSSEVTDESLKRARRGWDLLAGAMSHTDPSQKVLASTGPERAGALLDEALQKPASIANRSTIARQHKSASMLRWTEPESRAPHSPSTSFELGVPSTFFGEQPPEVSLEVQEPHSELALEVIHPKPSSISLMEAQEPHSERALEVIQRKPSSTSLMETQETHSERASEAFQRKRSSISLNAIDYIKLSMAPAPKPRSGHEVWPAKCRNFYALDASDSDGDRN